MTREQAIDAVGSVRSSTSGGELFVDRLAALGVLALNDESPAAGPTLADAEPSGPVDDCPCEYCVAARARMLRRAEVVGETAGDRGRAGMEATIAGLRDEVRGLKADNAVLDRARREAQAQVLDLLMTAPVVDPIRESPPGGLAQEAIDHSNQSTWYLAGVEANAIQAEHTPTASPEAPQRAKPQPPHNQGTEREAAGEGPHWRQVVEVRPGEVWVLSWESGRAPVLYEGRVTTGGAVIRIPAEYEPVATRSAPDAHTFTSRP